MKNEGGTMDVAGMKPVVIERIAALRNAMRAAEVNACIVPSSDAHVSEYPPLHWAMREWLSGFTGSVGTLVVTQDAAGLWVDSRYWEQAGRQLQESGIEAMRQGQAGVPEKEEWLAGRLTVGAQIAVDGWALAWKEAQELRQKLEAHDLIVCTDLDLVGSLWKARPPLPMKPVHAQEDSVAGETRAAKLLRVRKVMQEKNAGFMLLSALDDIAWLFNLRGDDVSYNPVFLAHALIDMRGARLFVDETKFTGALRGELVLDGVRIEPYGRVPEVLAALPAGERILIDPERTVVALAEAVREDVCVEQVPSPVMLMKARKNAVEQSHVRTAMEYDGAALCRFMAWFDEVGQAGEITEADVGVRLREERARHEDFLGESFGTIAAFRSNGALPHYHAEPGLASRIEGDGMLLLDSGGQYPGATTDITRMLPVGTPDPEHRKDCARVLRGVIALSRAVFPEGVGAPFIDALARAPIWADGIDYGHGTGHGVGCQLHVHEAPQRIAFRSRVSAQNVIEEGMITSVEPGIYRPGKWGVRIENLVLAQPAAKTEFGSFLRFETVTLCPIDLRCIDLGLLHADEIAWLDAYHAEVRRRLRPLLDGAALNWLLVRTEPAAKQSAV